MVVNQHTLIASEEPGSSSNLYSVSGSRTHSLVSDCVSLGCCNESDMREHYRGGSDSLSTQDLKFKVLLHRRKPEFHDALGDEDDVFRSNRSSGVKKSNRTRMCIFSADLLLFCGKLHLNLNWEPSWSSPPSELLTSDCTW